jgi:hypothetical protein
MDGRSFSWIESVVLVGAISAVGGFLRLEQISEGAKPVFIREWPGDATLVELIVASITFGVACAGPFVIATQFLIRGRSSGLSLGEWLWTVPLALYLTAVISTRAAIQISDHLTLLAASVCAMLLWVASSISILAFFAPRSASSHWSDRMGCFACLIAGLYLAFNLFAHPIKI